ncbi:MAG: hypothetical protein ACKVP7_07895, partial [Hyphomicrobiaceae bacterium]
ANIDRCRHRETQIAVRQLVGGIADKFSKARGRPWGSENSGEWLPRLEVKRSALRVLRRFTAETPLYCYRVLSDIAHSVRAYRWLAGDFYVIQQCQLGSAVLADVQSAKDHIPRMDGDCT